MFARFYKFSIVTLMTAALLTGCAARQSTPAKATNSDVPFFNVSTTDQEKTWWQWRGPKRDGISIEKGLLETWPEKGPAEMWRRSLGGGFSGIAVYDNRLYTMYTNGYDEYLVCLDAFSGKRIWKSRIDRNYVDPLGGDGPRSTPTVDGKRAYCVSAEGRFAAVDIATGKLLWSHDFVDDFAGKVPRWGYCISPLVYGENVLVEIGGQADNLIAAFDAISGELVWQKHDGAAGYSSPILTTLNTTEQALFFSGDKLIAVNPVSGDKYWSFKWHTEYNVNSATPIIIAPNKVFISSGYDKGSALVEISRDNGKFAAKEIWQTRKMKNHFSTSIFHQGFIYGFDNGVFKCLDVETGKETWRQKGHGKGALIFADGHFIILSDRGKLTLVKPSPEKYQEISRVQVLTGTCWTTPTLTGGKLFLRNQREIVALNLTAENDQQLGAKNP